MEIKNANSGYMFTRNPIVLSEPYSGADFDPAGGSLVVLLAGAIVYEGRFSPPLDLDISEVIDATVEYFPEVPAENDVPICRVLDDASLAERWGFYVNAEYDRIDYEARFIAVPGGVSKRFFKSCGDSDPFAKRFFNKSQNFFLTARETGRSINIKETELAPLYFLNASSAHIDLVDFATGKKLSYTVPPGLIALDLELVRRAFCINYNVWPSYIEVYKDYVHAVNIIMSKAETAPERYRVKFRNSLGVFEIVELPGKLSIKNADSDTETFSRFDNSTRGFSDFRDRFMPRQSGTISVQVTSSEDMLLLLDLATTDEAYLLDLDAEPMGVIPSIEGATYDARPEAPQMVTLILDFTQDDAPIARAEATQELSSNRIHSIEFSKEFN